MCPQPCPYLMDPPLRVVHRLPTACQHRNPPACTAIASPPHPAACVAQVAPLFAIHGLPKTPEDGESFLGGPGNEMTRSELQVGWLCMFWKHTCCPSVLF